MAVITSKTIGQSVEEQLPATNADEPKGAIQQHVEEIMKCCSPRSEIYSRCEAILAEVNKKTNRKGKNNGSR